MTDNDVKTTLLAQIEEAKTAYIQNPISVNFSVYMGTLNDYERYETRQRTLTLSHQLDEAYLLVKDAIIDYHENPTPKHYDTLMSSTQTLSHLLITQRALSGKPGSAMAIQSLSENYPLGMKVRDKLTRTKIKDILLTTNNLTETQITNLLSKLSVLSESTGKLEVQSIQKAFEKGEITLKEMNGMLHALRQQKEILDETVDQDGKMGFVEQDIYNSV